MFLEHYNDVIMTTMLSQITSHMIVYSTVYSGPDETIHQNSASLAFVQGIHRGPVNSPHKGPVTRKFFPFDDVIMVKPQVIGAEVYISWPMGPSDRSKSSDKSLHQHNGVSKMVFCGRHFSTAFLEWRYLNIKWNFIGICSWGCNWQYSGIGSGNGLVPNRRPAITWKMMTKFYDAIWRHMESSYWYHRIFYNGIKLILVKCCHWCAH